MCLLLCGQNPQAALTSSLRAAKKNWYSENNISKIHTLIECNMRMIILPRFVEISFAKSTILNIPTGSTNVHEIECLSYWFHCFVFFLLDLVIWCLHRAFCLPAAAPFRILLSSAIKIILIRWKDLCINGIWIILKSIFLYPHRSINLVMEFCGM